MLIKINMREDTPIYEQLRREIIRGILTGAFVPGEYLPSVRNMAESLSINMHTVAKTYNILKTEGFLSMEKSNRATVNQRDAFLADDVYLESLSKEMNHLIIEAQCRGLKKTELIKIIEQSFEENKGEK